MLWNSSPHPISDIRDWSNRGCLELQPPFQRRGVWSKDARIMLMDTIIKGVPMPKVFLATKIKDEQTYRIVIDGQQRITAILDFLKNKFCLEAPYEGPMIGKYFKDFQEPERTQFLRYSIDFNEANNPSEAEVREVYTRVNKYTVALNKQELRRADFPGDFLDYSEKISTWDFFENIRLFTPANRRRNTDVEYTSEILAGLISGVQDKKNTLDSFYRKYSEWEPKERKLVIERLDAVKSEISKIFYDDIALEKTRFKQKADFYSLVLALDGVLQKGFSIEGKDLDHLRQDFRSLNYEIAPESDFEIFSEYAIKCVSQANSSSSRRWRIDFINRILLGTYANKVPDDEDAEFFYSYMEDAEALRSQGELYCPSPDGIEGCECFSCGQLGEYNKNDWVISWVRDEVYQLSNCWWCHVSCAENNPNLHSLKRPLNDKNIS